MAKGIILVGVEHKDDNLENALGIISRHAADAKSVGIEDITIDCAKKLNKLAESGLPPEERLKQLDAMGYPHTFFFKLAFFASLHGMKIVPLESLYAKEKMARLDAEIRKLIERRRWLRYSGRYKGRLKKRFAGKIRRRENLDRAIAMPLRNKFMASRIKKDRPEMVIVGNAHSHKIAAENAVRKRYSVVKSPDLRARLYHAKAESYGLDWLLKARKKIRGIKRRIKR